MSTHISRGRVVGHVEVRSNLGLPSPLGKRYIRGEVVKDGISLDEKKLQNKDLDVNEKAFNFTLSVDSHREAAETQPATAQQRAWPFIPIPNRPNPFFEGEGISGCLHYFLS